MRLPLVGLLVLLVGCGKPPATLSHGKPVAYWVQALQDSDVKVRRRAVQSLGNVGVADPATVPALIGAAKDRDAKVRGEAILALLRIGPDAREAIPVLTEAQKDKDAQVRSYAAKALQKIADGQ
jgi:HEAT repeat protein